MSDEVPGYALRLPSPGEACVSVMRVAGADGVAVWTEVCREAAVAATATHYSAEELDGLVAVLKRRPGALGVVGYSLGVRVTTYRALRTLASLRRTA